MLLYTFSHENFSKLDRCSAYISTSPVKYNEANPPYFTDPIKQWARIGCRSPFSLVSDHNSSTHTIYAPILIAPSSKSLHTRPGARSQGATGLLLKKMHAKPSLRSSLRKAVMKHLSRYGSQSRVTKNRIKMWRRQQGLVGGGNQRWIMVTS